jgi:hypothetical protein
MLRCEAVVRTDVSDEHISAIIRASIISELGTTLPVTSNRSKMRTITVILMMEAILSSETSVLTRATVYHPRRRIFHGNEPSDSIKCRRIPGYFSN